MLERSEAPVDNRVVESIVAIERAQEVPTFTEVGRGHAGADRVILRAKSRVTGRSSRRHLIITSRIAPDCHLSEFGRKHLQHVLTDWFPQAIYGDLTAETVRVDVIVSDSGIGNVYTAAFLKGDGSVIKTTDYAEGRLKHAKCPSYDQERSGYCGTRDGADFRLVTYTTGRLPEAPAPAVRALRKRSNEDQKP